MKIKEDFEHKGEPHILVTPHYNMMKLQGVRDFANSGGLFGLGLVSKKFGMIPDRLVEQYRLKHHSVTLHIGSYDIVSEVYPDGYCRAFFKGEWIAGTSVSSLIESINTVIREMRFYSCDLEK